MQVLLRSDSNIDASHLLVEHLEAVVKGALGRFGNRVTRVEAHLSDVHSPANVAAGSIHCTLEARLAGLQAVVVKEQADTVHQAIEGGVRKLERAVGEAIAKHDPRHQRANPAATMPDDEAEPPG